MRSALTPQLRSADEREQIRAANRSALERFMGKDATPWWEEGADQSGFAPDFLFQNPWTPPGLRGAGITPPEDTKEFFRWLQSAVTSFEVRFEKIHDMADPDTFWMEYYGRGECSWGSGGPYEQLELTFVRFDQQGRLSRYVEHYDPTRFLRSCGEVVPDWDYRADRIGHGLADHRAPVDSLESYIERRRAQDAKDEAALDVRSLSEPDRVALRARNQEIIERFVSIGGAPWWETAALQEDLVSDEFTLEMPHFEHIGAVTFGAGDWQQVVEWLRATAHDFTVQLSCRYDMEDPFSFWVEYDASGTVDWGAGGAYRHFAVAFVRVDESGRLLRWREHFNPARMLEVAVPWTQPEFDYNADRRRHGLNEVDSRYVPVEEYLAQRAIDAAAGRTL